MQQVFLAFAQRSKSWLFWLENHTVAKYFTEAGTNTVFQLTRDNTLTDIHVLARVAGFLVEIDRLPHGTSGLLVIADQLGARVGAKLERLNLHGNRPLNPAICRILCKSGLWAQMILLPMKTLCDIQTCADSDDIQWITILNDSDHLPCSTPWNRSGDLSQTCKPA